MGHKKKHHKEHKHEKSINPQVRLPSTSVGEKDVGHRLEIVLKGDAADCVEAVVSSIAKLALSGVAIDIIHTGVGAVNKNDVMMAETGSRLILGFNVDVMPHLESMLADHGVEVRLYDVIYRLTEDVKQIASSLVEQESEEKIIGRARVIALFKSSRKGIILGCEINDGNLAQGDKFRVISAMGPVYSGRINSLHIEKDLVTKAVKGQKVGLKIVDFKKVHIGDLVESYRSVGRRTSAKWQPKGGIIKQLAT